MKKLAFGLVLLFAIISSSNAQSSPTNLLEKLSKENEVVNINVGGFLLTMAKPIIALYAKEAMPVINGVDKIQIIASEGCNSRAEDNYTSTIKNMKDENGYETIVQVKDRTDFVRVMLKAVDKKIKDIYIFCCDSTNVTAIKLAGNIKSQDIEKMIEKYNKKD